MTEHVLAYDHSIVPQEQGWDCGPASTQVVLSGLGIVDSEGDLIPREGTDQDGTDYVGMVETALNQLSPDSKYTSVYLPDDPPSQAQKDVLWANIVSSINAGRGVVMNWVAPPSNYPVGVKGSQSPSYSGGTVFHYVPCMGYDDDPALRALWIADPGFSPFGYWISFDQAASLIPPKGYCYSTAAPAVVNQPPPPPPPPVEDPPPADLSASDQHALDIINEGIRRGITVRGQQIALATGLVESNITIYANSKVPASMDIPHEAVGTDGFSVGIFQQQVVGPPWWWGDAATCMDPTLSAGLFYDRLAGLDYNGSNSPGSYAQAVQGSAFPDRYDERFADAQALYARLISLPTGGDTFMPALTDDEQRELLDNTRQFAVYQRESRSRLRWPAQGPVDTCAGFAWNADGFGHESQTERLAVVYGDVLSIANLYAVANTLEDGRENDAELAMRILEKCDQGAVARAGIQMSQWVAAEAAFDAANPKIVPAS